MTAAEIGSVTARLRGDIRWSIRPHDRVTGAVWRGGTTTDFTSSLYLGLHHPSRLLPPLSALTTGVPAALHEAASARRLAARLAGLIGTEAATLGSSTLHLFWDLFSPETDRDVTLFPDTALYPIARWGVERAAACGVPVSALPHHAPDELRRRLMAREWTRVRPVVVTDGFCPRCGRVAPLAAYLETVRRRRGLLVVDDSQALGILGGRPCADAPFGTGGGGALRWHRLVGAEVLVVASLAKGFGVPVAVLAGSKEAIRRFEARSSTRVHCSPPSAAVIQAAHRALGVNRGRGDAIRARLGRLVRHFRRRLAEVGLAACGGPFPVQTLSSITGRDAATVYDRLIRLGVSAVLSQGHDTRARLSFLLTARHSTTDLDRSVDALTRATAGIGKGGES